MKVRFLEATMLLGTHYNKGDFIDITDKAIYEDWFGRKMVEPVTAEIDRLKAVLADQSIAKYPGSDTKPPEPVEAVVTLKEGGVEKKVSAEELLASAPAPAVEPAPIPATAKKPRKKG